MFSQRLAYEKLETLARTSKTGWIPEYHSLSEIDSFNSHFAAIQQKAEYDGVEYIEDRLGPEEMAWIDNEYKISACDYHYWSNGYATINASGEIKRHERRVSQAMLVDLWAERQELGFGIEEQILKARQQGISTEVELAITHQVNFGMGVKAAVASYDSDACERMAGMMQLAYNEMPAWMRANPTSDRAGSLMAFGGNSTRLTLYSGRKAAGIARGDTPSVIHISEVCEFPQAETVIENSLFAAVHPGPRVFMVLESTGNGNTDWWAKTWYSSRDYWHMGEARLQPVFFPWFCAEDLFPTYNWSKEHPYPPDWKPTLPETRRMMDKCAAYVAQTPMMRKHYGDGWRLPTRQAWWWEQAFLEARRKGNEKGFMQEHPCVTGDTRISSNMGMIRIKEAHPLSGAHTTESGSVNQWIPRGEKPIFQLKTKDGRILRGTREHLINTPAGWRELGSLEEGEQVVLSPPMFAEYAYYHQWSDTDLYQSQRYICRELSRFLGYFMGDGSFYSDCVEFACDSKDQDVIEDIARLIQFLIGKPAQINKIKGYTRVRSGSIFWKPLLNSLGCLEHKMHVEGRTNGMKRKVCVPEGIFRSPKLMVKEFLSALYECDGHAYRESPRVKLYSKHDDFLRDVQLLLLGFRIRAKFMKQDLKSGDGHSYTGRSLEIPAAFANRFYDDIGFIGSRKQNSGKRRIEGKKGRPVTVEFLDEVLSVTETGICEKVFDLSIEGSHRFSANGIQVHNCDDIEALQPKKKTVFDLQEVKVQEEHRAAYTVWGITGEQILEKYYPDPLMIDYTRERFQCSYLGKASTVNGEQPKEFKWNFIPMKQPVEKGAEIFRGDGLLLVFHWPDADYDYGIGVDNGGGAGQDNSVIAVNAKCKTRNEPDKIAAMWFSNRVDPALTHAWVMAICALYKSEMPAGNEPLVGIEQVYGMGDNCQTQMMAMGYRRMYKFSRLDGKNPEADKRHSKRFGWFTGSWSRGFMLSLYKLAVENHWYQLNDPFLLKNELPAFQVGATDGGKTKWEHDKDKHDDRIFATAIAFVIMNDTESLSRRVQDPYETEDKPVETDYSYPGGIDVPYSVVAGEFSEVHDVIVREAKKMSGMPGREAR